jgi:heterodisulfide reductase subunit C
VVIKKKIENSVLEKVIEKGGHVRSDFEEEKKEWVKFCLRIKSSTLNEIDKALETMIGLNKTGFILQAIDEKLRKKNE